MIWTRLVFGGFGRRGLEDVVALVVLAIASALVASALMVVAGARHAMTRAEREDRPDIVQVKSRFNRAVFETPRSGNLQPLTLPVYEPLIDPEKLNTAGAVPFFPGNRCFATSCRARAFSISTFSVSSRRKSSA